MTALPRVVLSSVDHQEKTESAESSTELEGLVDSLPGMLFRTINAPGWPLKYISGGCLGITGYRPAELVGDPVVSYDALIHPADLDRVMQAMDDAAREKRSYVIEYRLSTKAGGEKWVWEQGHCVFSKSGEVDGIEGFTTDISSLKASQEELRLAKRKYQDIFQNATEGIFQTSMDGSYISVNPALARIYGYDSPEEMMANLTDIQKQLYVMPERRSDFVRIMEKHHFVVRFESQIRRRDGSVIWISENARAVRDESGTIRYYEGSVVDVTARKRAEEALEKERSMLRTLIDHWPDHIYVRNREGRYLLSNMAHTQSLTMNSPSEVEGKRAEDFFVPSRAAQFTIEDMDLMEGGEAVLDREEVRNRGETSEQWVLTSKLPLRNKEGEILGLVGITRDITRHKRLEEQLLQSQKMEAVGTLAGGVAHDFNNILTAILGYSEMIVSRAAQDERLRSDAEQIYAGGLRAAALTQQLLAFSRKQIVQTRVLNVNTVVQGMESMLRRLVGENLQFVCKLRPEVSAVRADGGQLEQVVMNLVVNARDAMPEGGSLVIETANVMLDEEYTSQHAGVKPGRYARISVSDTGTGIPPQIIKRIFEPFFTTKEQGKGTGLGLATSYGIIVQSGGHIGVYSEMGSGTTFNIYLPACEQSTVDLADVEGRGEIPRGTETILLVEDDVSVRTLTAASLADLGYAVLEASNGEEALSQIAERRDHSSIDLVLTDVVMPKLGGKRLAESIEQVRPETKILFTSGYNEEAVLLQGILEDEFAFLQKPFTLPSLAAKVRGVLDNN